MFDFAIRRLAMSEAEAALRIRAAKVCRAFPEALELLERCEVHLSALSLLAPILRTDNLYLLQAARFKSKAEVLQLIAAHSPRPDTPDSVRRMPAARPSARAQPGMKPPSAVAPSGQPPSAVAPPAQLPPSAADRIEPLSAARHRFSFTGSQRLRDLLKEVQDLRRHRYPGGELEAIFESALELLAAVEKKRRFALTPSPRCPYAGRAGANTKHSRYIPHDVRRKAWARHEGRCCFVSADGTRCNSRSWLEFHHVAPFARGGAGSADNIALVCRAHNALHADHDFGRTFMRRRRELVQTRVRSDAARVRETGEMV